MLIEDHLNFTGVEPADRRRTTTRIGLRFPDMSRAYDPDLRDAARRAAEAAGVALRYGIYAGVAGPSLETSAERRFLRSAGADAVGMSTVLEVIAAVHAGMRVLGFSAICNDANGGPDQAPDTIEAVLAKPNRRVRDRGGAARGCCRSCEAIRAAAVGILRPGWSIGKRRRQNAQSGGSFVRAPGTRCRALAQKVSRL